MRGWVHLKIRSTFNVRPRSKRFCELNGLILHVYKTQEQCQLQKRYRSYFVKHVANWQGKKFGVLITVSELNQEVNKVLEMDFYAQVELESWLNAFRERTKQKVDVAKPDMLRLGASLHRGLENSKGENNCFLNVILQSFWHLRSMRKLILNAKVDQDCTVIQALKNIMQAYQDPKSGQLHPGALRQGLSDMYQSEKAFQVGQMCDAEETLTILLDVMHQEAVHVQVRSKEINELMTTPHRILDSMTSMEESLPLAFEDTSIPHLVFGHQIYDRTICNTCGIKSSFELYSNLVFNLYVSDMITENGTTLESVMRSLPEKLDIPRGCNEKGCDGKIAIERIIQRFPKVFAISLMWSTDHTSKEDAFATLRVINDRLDLTRAFSTKTPSPQNAQPKHHFRGFVCYYGQHYFAFFYSTAHRSWLLFDDNTVRRIGNWESVVQKCRMGRYQPVLLFYEVPDTQQDSSIGIEAVEFTPSSTQNRTRVLSEHGKSLLLTALSPSSAPTLDHYDVTFDHKTIGLFLEDVQGVLRMTKFPQQSSGIPFAAEASNLIEPYDQIVSINQSTLHHSNVQQAISEINRQGRPVVIRFKRSPAYINLLEMGFSKPLIRQGLLFAKGDATIAANYCFEKCTV